MDYIEVPMIIPVVNIDDVIYIFAIIGILTTIQFLLNFGIRCIFDLKYVNK